MDKECSTCGKNKNIKEFYGCKGKKCKECHKESERKKRDNLKNLEIPDEFWNCNGCGKNKHASNFRPQRKKCKECEKKNTEKNTEREIKEKTKLLSGVITTKNNMQNFRQIGIKKINQKEMKHIMKDTKTILNLNCVAYVEEEYYT